MDGAVAYPDDLLNNMFNNIYESNEGKYIRNTGVIGIVTLVNSINNMCATLSQDIAAPFDTICFFNEGVLVIDGVVTKLPVTNFW
jgi:DUF917 family protein